MVHVLQILSSLKNGGGIQSMLKNYYTIMDLSSIQTDFIVCGDDVGELEAWFKERGSQVYHVPPRSRNFAANIFGIRAIIRNGSYDVVHCHQDYRGAVAIAIAKRYGVKKRIIHCHQAYPPENAVKKLRRYLSTRVLLRDATDFVACSALAGKWLYGEQMLKVGRVTILHNAISAERYIFSEENRERIRAELSIATDAIVVGHIGRFSYQKNHALLIEIFRAFHQEHGNAVLLLIGNGELSPEIQNRVNELKLEDQVRFLGVRQDVPVLFSAMDAFLLPSRFEGLPVVAIEAQANGLPVICSGRISREVQVADNVFFTDEDAYENVTTWCSTIDAALRKGRTDNRQAMIRAGYDIHQEAGKLEKLYRT